MRYGINLNWGGNTIIEMVIKIPLPIIKKDRWLCFETFEILEGIKILDYMFYFRMRYKRFGFPIILDSRFWFNPINPKTILTRKDIEDRYKKKNGRWTSNVDFVKDLLNGAEAIKNIPIIPHVNLI